MMKNNRKLPGEAALLLGLLLNSFASTMLIRSGFGMSVTSAVPFILSQRFPTPSYGVWNAMIQCAWLLVPVLAFRKLPLSYALSFLLAFLFGFFLDMWQWLLADLPQTLAFRCLWFATGYATMSLGIGFLMRCGLPVLPFDTVPRAFVLERGVSIRVARTVYDLTNASLGLLLSLSLFGRVIAIGPGSIVCALFLGTGAGYAAAFYDQHVVIAPHFRRFAEVLGG